MEPVTFGMAGFSLMSGMGGIGLTTSATATAVTTAATATTVAATATAAAATTAAAAATVSMPLWLPVAGVVGAVVGLPSGAHEQQHGAALGCGSFGVAQTVPSLSLYGSLLRPRLIAGKTQSWGWRYCRTYVQHTALQACGAMGLWGKSRCILRLRCKSPRIRRCEEYLAPRHQTTKPSVELTGSLQACRLWVCESERG